MATILYLGDDFSITENGKFSIETKVGLNDQGRPDTLETFIDIEGDVTQGGNIDGGAIGTDPAAVYAAMESIQDQCNGGNPARFYVEVDGNVKFDYPPSECINSPIVVNFRTIDNPGAGANHWKYGVTVYIRQLHETNTNGVLNFQSTIDTTSIITEEGPRPIRKHWAASCTARNASAALDFIKTLKPSAPTLIETLARFFQEARATGDWVWDYAQDQTIEEEITVTGLGPSYVASTQVGADGEDVMPLIHRTPRKPIVVVLNGVISSTNPARVTLPELHWSEDDEFFHDLGEEQVGERVIYDPMRGLYRLNYQERWIGRKYTPPDHHGHDKIPQLPEPADGAIAGIVGAN